MICFLDFYNSNFSLTISISSALIMKGMETILSLVSSTNVSFVVVVAMGLIDVSLNKKILLQLFLLYIFINFDIIYNYLTHPLGCRIIGV